MDHSALLAVNEGVGQIFKVGRPQELVAHKSKFIAADRGIRDNRNSGQLNCASFFVSTEDLLANLPMCSLSAEEL